MEGWCLLFAEGLIVIFQGCKGGLCKLCVEELLVNAGNKVYIPDQITGSNSVLIDDAFDLVIGQTET